MPVHPCASVTLKKWTTIKKVSLTENVPVGEPTDTILARRNVQISACLGIVAACVDIRVIYYDMCSSCVDIYHSSLDITMISRDIRL